MLEVTLTVNGQPVTGTVEPRRTLADFLREDLGLTGTKLGCEHGVCGACTVMLDGAPVRACLMLAVQARGASIVTIEGLRLAGGDLHPIQQAFAAHQGLQCGFCTPGMVISAYALLQDNPHPTEAEIRAGLSGNICRCTGYHGIVEAVKACVARGVGSDD